MSTIKSSDLPRLATFVGVLFGAGIGCVLSRTMTFNLVYSIAICSVVAGALGLVFGFLAQERLTSRKFANAADTSSLTAAGVFIVTNIYLFLFVPHAVFICGVILGTTVFAYRLVRKQWRTKVLALGLIVFAATASIGGAAQRSPLLVAVGVIVGLSGFALVVQILRGRLHVSGG